MQGLAGIDSVTSQGFPQSIGIADIPGHHQMGNTLGLKSGSGGLARHRIVFCSHHDQGKLRERLAAPGAGSDGVEQFLQQGAVAAAGVDHIAGLCCQFLAVEQG